MKIFGGWLPFVGFREYVYTDREDLDDFEDFFDQENLIAVAVRTFEVEWFEYGFGMVYKTIFYKKEV